MRIACICNINHAQFILARYLRDMGHEVTLFLMEEYPNFYPEYDTYRPLEGIKVVELPWKHKELFKVAKNEIKGLLGGYDIYCGSEFAPAFLFKAGLPLHIYIPIGTDLVDYPFHKLRGMIPATWAIDEYQFHLYQKGGIRYAQSLFMNAGGDEVLEGALRNIKFRGTRYPISLPYLYLPEYESENAISPYENAIRELRGKNELLLISHGRCEFRDKNSVHYKGTEMMLQGLASFIKAGNTSTCLVMLEYGNDWPLAKDLAMELGIADHIFWLPKSGRKDIFPILKYFDAGFGTISYPHWSYNVAMELVAAGVPLIQRGRKDEKIYPFLEAKNDAEVVVQLYALKSAGGGNLIEKNVLKNWFKSFQIAPALDDLKRVTGSIQPGSKTTRGLAIYLNWNFLKSVVYFLSKVKLRFLPS